MRWVTVVELGVGLVALNIAGCDPGGGGDVTGGSTGGASSTSVTASSGPTTSTTDPSASATSADGSASGSDGATAGSGSDGGCPDEACSNLCPEECAPMAECNGTFVSCSCDCPGDCSLEHTACELAEQSKVPPVDCGVATLDDDLATWEAVRACALDSAAASDAFKAVFEHQGFDSLPTSAFVGQVGFVYSLSRLTQDLGEVPGVTTISQASCSGLAEVGDCTVSVGDHCIFCVDFMALDPICGP